jgi:molecular chaperone HscB
MTDIIISSPKAGRYAAEWSSRVNEAFGVLDNPPSRATYLVSPSLSPLSPCIYITNTYGNQLSLAGVTIEETDSVTDSELLLSILDTRESLEEATDESEVLNIRAHNDGQSRPSVPPCPYQCTKNTTHSLFSLSFFIQPICKTQSTC